MCGDCVMQNELERCFRVMNVTECLVSDEITTLLGSQFAQVGTCGAVDSATLKACASHAAFLVAVCCVRQHTNTLYMGSPSLQPGEVV